MSIIRRSSIALLALPVLFAIACDQAPTREIKAAEDALQKAREADAETYVSDRFHEAEAALQMAQRKVAEKDYRGALSSANEANEKARAAFQGAAPARILAKSAAETRVAEIQAELEEVATVRQEATEAQVPEEAFAEVAPRADEVNEGLEGIGKQLAAGDLLGAKAAAEELKAKTPGLADAFREARAAWVEAHPKAKPKTKAKR